MNEFAPRSSARASGRRRWLARVIVLVCIGALVAGVWWLGARDRASPAGDGFGMWRGGPMPAATVGLALARDGQLPVVIHALGTVTPVHSVVVRPQVSGVLTQVLFEEGQLVEEGQLLARIDAAPFEQALAQARGQRLRDEAQLKAARVMLQRYETLLAQDSIARQEVDTQAALVEQLAGAVQADRAAQASAQIDLDHTRIVAPVSGRVGLRAVDAGNLVSGGGASELATITQMDPIDIRFAVPQDRIRDLIGAARRGQLPVDATGRSRETLLGRGHFLTLDNAIDPGTGTVMAKARFDNADEAFFPNQFVNVRVQLGTTHGVLVPVTAVRTGPEGDYVYAVDDERTAHMRRVTRGLTTDDEVLIVDGLESGEQVVAEGGDRVKDGARVRVAGAPADGEQPAARPAG